MQTYRLKLTDDGIGIAKFIDFDGLDASSALSVLSNESGGRRAELWDGARLVCTIERDSEGSGFWVVNPVVRARAKAA